MLINYILFHTLDVVNTNNIGIIIICCVLI